MTTNSSNTQDFNTLTNTTTVTWVNNSTIPNWYSQRTGTGTTILVSDGTSSGGNLYSYGTTASSERALGTVGSANVAAGNFAHGVLLQNTSGATITDIKVSYTLEQWRFSGATAAQAIDVYYHTSASIDTALTPSNNTGWTQITGLTLSSPIISGVTGPLNGNAVANKVSLSNVPIPSLSLPDNNYIMLKWEDINHAGNDHGLGIDDVTITWTTGSTLPALAITSASMSFGGQTVLTNSASQSDTVSGTNLTGFPDSITIKAPSVDFQVSKDNSTWTDSVNIYYSSATLVKTAFWVRFTPQSGGNKSGINVTVNGGGVAAPTLLAVSGTGLDPVGPAPYTVAGSTYTQNFNGLPNSGGLITLGNVGPKEWI